MVERTLTTSRPRARYLVGTDARITVALSRFLPTRTMDALLSRAVGLLDGCRIAKVGGPTGAGNDAYEPTAVRSQGAAPTA
jgi:hypothetical protein